MTFVYILLFIVCLSTLIMVHEAGHLATAKIFKVYCFEYSIGFGPKIFSIRRKGTETAFSLRAIPFGGFVSMYGESDSIPEGHEPIDPSRSIEAIKKWKKCIILVAGVMMNFVLALHIFFIYEVAFPAHVARIGHITVKEDSIVYNAGLRSQDFVYSPSLEDEHTYIFYDDSASLEYNDSSVKEMYFGFDFSNITLKDQRLYSYAIAFAKKSLGTLPTESYTPVSYDQAINGDYSSDEVVLNSIDGYIRAVSTKYNKSTQLYTCHLAITQNYLDDESLAFVIELTLSKDEYGEFKYVPIGAFATFVADIEQKETSNHQKYNVMSIVGIDNFQTSYPSVLDGDKLTEKSGGAKPVKLSFNFYKLNEETNIGRGDAMPVSDIEVDSEGRLPKELGSSMQLDSYYHKFGEAVGNTFKDFGNATTLIFRGLGSLFTKDGWKNVGGIIAIGVSTTQVLKQNGFGLFLYYWAIISVNLGIVNLLPFPGLDGWQFLVTAVEGISHKSIPTKVKTIMSAIGIGLLFILMILIIIKDIVALV